MLFFLKTYFKTSQYSQGNEINSVRLEVNLERGSKTEVKKVYSCRPESSLKGCPKESALSSESALR